MGDAVALLVSCVQEEKDDAGTTASNSSDQWDGGGADELTQKGVFLKSGQRSMGAKRLSVASPRLRGKRKSIDPGKSAKREE
jgi:hypothetical protein